MGKTWKSVELSSELAEKAKRFFKTNEIQYEASAAYNLIHIEAFVDEHDIEAYENFISERA